MGEEGQEKKRVIRVEKKESERERGEESEGGREGTSKRDNAALMRCRLGSVLILASRSRLNLVHLTSPHLTRLRFALSCLPCFTLPCLALLCFVLSCLALPSLASPNLASPCLTLPYYGGNCRLST